ncbi:MAG: BrnT family toxin [Blastocatellia bacterium]|nr:BrnT family toxin [Blastocatellia bacterium]MBN8725835.1 BrnT family toxin [Acidobacteriota bacterium]
MKNILEIFSTEEYERKLLLKHNVEMYEVEEVIFEDAPKFKHVEKGIKIEREDKYRILGQTNSGRYLVVFFLYKLDGRALIVSARDMAEKERKQYERK